jgi:hypothetical protein
MSTSTSTSATRADTGAVVAIWLVAVRRFIMGPKLSLRV